VTINASEKLAAEMQVAHDRMDWLPGSVYHDLTREQDGMRAAQQTVLVEVKTAREGVAPARGPCWPAERKAYEAAIGCFEDCANPRVLVDAHKLLRSHAAELFTLGGGVGDSDGPVAAALVQVDMWCKYLLVTLSPQCEQEDVSALLKAILAAMNHTDPNDAAAAVVKRDWEVHLVWHGSSACYERKAYHYAHRQRWEGKSVSHTTSTTRSSPSGKEYHGRRQTTASLSPGNLRSLTATPRSSCTTCMPKVSGAGLRFGLPDHQTT